MIELREFGFPSIQRWYGTDGEPEYILEFFLWLEEESLPDIKDWDWVLHVEDWMTLHIMRASEDEG